MKRVTLWLVGISLVLLAAGGAYELLRAQRGATGSSANTGAPPARPLPVTAAIVEMKDFPIYRIGLGTVQAYNTVTVQRSALHRRSLSPGDHRLAQRVSGAARRR